MCLDVYIYQRVCVMALGRAAATGLLSRPVDFAIGPQFPRQHVCPVCTLLYMSVSVWFVCLSGVFVSGVFTLFRVCVSVRVCVWCVCVWCVHSVPCVCVSGVYRRA